MTFRALGQTRFAGNLHSFYHRKIADSFIVFLLLGNLVLNQLSTEAASTLASGANAFSNSF